MLLRCWMDVASSPATASREDAKWGVRSCDQMIICSLYADVVYKSLSSNLVVGLQDIVDVPHCVFYIANRSPSRSITCAEGKAIVLSYAAIRS